MNSQQYWMTSQNDEMAKLISLIGEYKSDENRLYDSKINFVPNAATQSQPHPPLQSSMSTNKNVLKDISNTIPATNTNSKYRMIRRRNNEFSQNLFPDKDACSSSSLASVSMKPLTFSELQSRTDSQSTIPRNLSLLFTNREGIIQVSLRNGIRIEITVDNSIRLTSCSGQIVISLSKTGDASALKHPNGYVQQFGKDVQIIANSRCSNTTRYANMSPNGISFTSSKVAEIFLLDSIGTRKTKDYFPKLTGDNTTSVFLGKARYGLSCYDEITNIIQKATYKKCVEDDTEVININDYRIWQMRDGLVTVARISYPFKIRTSPKNCSLTLSTPEVHATASSRDSPHLFVRHQDQSMHFDGGNFVVRYNGNSSGFDKSDFLIVY